MSYRARGQMCIGPVRQMVLGWFETSDRGPRRSFPRNFWLVLPREERCGRTPGQGMMRPAGRVPAGAIALFTQPMRLQTMHRFTLPCLRTFSSSPIPAAGLSPEQRKKLIRDAKKGKPMKLRRLADIPDDVGYLGILTTLTVCSLCADWRRIDDSAYEQGLA
jgi:hypothetical protein